MYPCNGSLSRPRVYQATGSAASRLVQMCRQCIDMWGPIVIDKAVRGTQQHREWLSLAERAEYGESPL